MQQLNLRNYMEIAEMNIDKYKTFLVCTQNKTFYDAANALYTTPSTVSKHINSLEKDMGVRLFTRSPKGLVLTREGEIRKPLIEKIVTIYEDLVDELAFSSDSENVTLFSTPLFARFQISGLIRSFVQECHYSVSVTEMDRPFLALNNHQAEIIITPGFHFFEKANYDYIAFEIGRYGLLLPKEHPMASLPAVSCDDLGGETIIVMNDPIYKTLAEKFFSGRAAQPIIEYKVNGVRTDLLRLYAYEHGKPALFSSDLYDVYHPSEQVFVPFKENFAITAYMVRRKGARISAGARSFWKFGEKWLTENMNANVFYGA